MCNMILANAWFYTWALLPLLIFAARIMDVSLGTVRLIFVSRGMKYLAPLVGFFEVLTWLLAIGQIMKNLSNPVCYIAYAAGFAMGNFVGIWIAERLSLGVVLVRVVTQKDASPLVDKLKARDYGLTCVDSSEKANSRSPQSCIFAALMAAKMFFQFLSLTPNIMTQSVLNFEF